MMIDNVGDIDDYDVDGDGENEGDRNDDDDRRDSVYVGDGNAARECQM